MWANITHIQVKAHNMIRSVTTKSSTFWPNCETNALSFSGLAIYFMVNSQKGTSEKWSYPKFHDSSLEYPLACIRIMKIPPSCDRHDMKSDLTKLSSFVHLCIPALTLYPILYCSCKHQNFQVYPQSVWFKETAMHNLYSFGLNPAFLPELF